MSPAANYTMTTHEALSILTLAIKNVNPCYIRIDAIPDCDIKRIQVERSFAYELYHQWSLLLDTFWNLNTHNDKLRLNGEITKDLDLISHSYPDMVLHGGQEYIENQLLVCEIKRVDGSYPDSSKIFDDLKKLSQFLHLRASKGRNQIDANFQSAVFIVANIDRERLEEKIKSALAGNHNEARDILSDAHNINCISVEIDHREKLEVSLFTLDELFTR